MRAEGSRDWIRPAEIVGGPGMPPPVALAWPRADFRLAGLEFLIGLLSTAFPPADDTAWADLFFQPPPVGQLDNVFRPLREAFWLDGDGPCFCQDLDAMAFTEGVKRIEIETLLIEAPREETVKNGRDVPVRAGRVTRMSRAAAAIALFTLQSWAPKGGRRHRTSLRRGGPLTTLVLPGVPAGQDQATLWQVVWTNVGCGTPPDASDLPRVFPWLAPTPSGRDVTPQDAHALQAFWGMPRRIRLEWEAAPDETPCDLLGIRDTVVATGWRQQPGGIHYDAWLHPLSPYRSKDGCTWLPMHARGGIGYRDWHALVHEDEDREGLRRPAACVAAFLEDRRAVLRERDRAVVTRARLLVGGYDMENTMARQFLEAEFPVLATGDSETYAGQVRLARRLAEGATEAASLLRKHLQKGLGREQGNVTQRPGARGRAAPGRPRLPADSTFLQAVQARFWRETEDEFFRLVEQVHAALAAGPLSDDAETAFAREWLECLERACLRLFDETLPVNPDMDLLAAAARIQARRFLRLAFRGIGADGKRLYPQLGLPVPQARETRRKGAVT